MVSVIIPVYNGLKYLKETLNSVLSQSYKNYEIIIVNDGSTDNSQEIINDYISQKPHIIRAFNQKNDGVSAARNCGIKEARGNYISFIDQDDLWHPTKLAKQVYILDHNTHIGLISCSFYYINISSERIELNNILDHDFNNETVRDQLLIRNVVGPPSCVMVRKECLEKVGLFDLKLSSGPEDRDLWFRICNHYPCEFIYEELCAFRLHSDNAHKNIPKMKENQKKYINKYKHYYKNSMLLRAYSLVYLDAAREYWDMGFRLKTFVNAVWSIIYYPFMLEKHDDKYIILLKSIFKYTR